MQLFVGGVDVTQLTESVTTSGSRKECSRTLKASIVQSPSDKNLPVVSLKAGMPVVFQETGQYFVGVLMNPSRSTASNKVDITAKDLGIYIKKNKVSDKAKKVTPEVFAADVFKKYGIPVGSLAETGFKFSRVFLAKTLYEVIMTGYFLAAAGNGKKYQLIMEGTAVSVLEQGAYVAAVISEGENLIEAAYSESIENMINQVDLIDKNGKIVQSVKGDMSYGIMRDQVTYSKNSDNVAEAEKIIREKGLERNASVQNIGNAACTSGNAVLIKESYTGLYGQFYIESDTHSWKNGVYTNSLTLEWENTMDSDTAKSILSEDKKTSKGKKTDKDDLNFVDTSGKPYNWE